MGQTSPETTSFLTRAIEDREYTVRMTALDLLAQRGEDGEAALYSASMHSPDPLVRSHATELLNQLK
jgi:HEAT repeat protein